uniref:Uncharacterized protein n=1 Tax=Rhizophora mucronata TaxID=61149 RepID=A0A2P2QIR0_RHIMU
MKPPPLKNQIQNLKAISQELLMEISCPHCHFDDNCSQLGHPI